MDTIASIQTALASKADLVSGVLQTSEIPAIPISSVTGLQTALNGCATLSGGTVPLSEMPQNIPQSYISGLPNVLSHTPTLINGVVPVSQLPALNLPNTQTVADTTALTALTTSQAGPGTLALATGERGRHLCADRF